MAVGHTPYGYRIENGAAVIDETQAEQIRKIFEGYLSGLGLMNAAEAAGMKMFHSGVKRILTNKHYIGDEYYPAIVDEESFRKAGDELIRRAGALGRIREPKAIINEPYITVTFSIGKIKRKYDDPFKQAEYAYSMIKEAEMNA